MKRLLFIVLISYCFTPCSCQNKKSDFIKHLGEGYYAIPNLINGKLILPSYSNYENKSDSIFLEKILYQEKRKDCFLLIANMMGSKTSLILDIQNGDSIKVNYVEQLAKIDTFEKHQLKGYSFILISSHYTDMCSEMEGLTIYILTNDSLHKSFEGIRSQDFNNVDTNLCKNGISFKQDFDLMLENNNVVLISRKKIEGALKVKKYYLKGYIFK